MFFRSPSSAPRIPSTKTESFPQSLLGLHPEGHHASVHDIGAIARDDALVNNVGKIANYALTARILLAGKIATRLLDIHHGAELGHPRPRPTTRRFSTALDLLGATHVFEVAAAERKPAKVSAGRADTRSSSTPEKRPRLRKGPSER